MPKKVLMCVFPFLEKKSLEIKKHLLNSIERESQYCTLKILFKSPAKIVNHFVLKKCFQKENFTLVLGQFSRKDSRTYGNFTFEKQTH